MRKKAVILALIVFTLLLLLLSRLVRLPLLPVHAHQAIPSHTALFFEMGTDVFSNPGIARTSLMDLFLPADFANEIAFMGGVLGEKNTRSKERPVYISVNPSQRFGTNLLFIMPKLDGIGDWHQQLQTDGWQSRTHQFDGQSLVTLKREGVSFAFTRYRNLFIFARHDYLVENAISQLKQPNSSICRDGHFKKVFKAQKKDENATPVFINLKNFSAQFAPLLNTSKYGHLKNLGQVGSWLQLSIPHENGAHKWTGHFAPDESNPFFEASKKKAGSVSKEIWLNIPNNLSGFMALKLDALPAVFNSHFLSPYLKTEMGVGLGEPMENQLYEQFLLFRTDEAALAEKTLNQTAGKPASEYQMFNIWQLGEASGLPFIGASPYFVSVVGDYILFSNSLAGAERWLGKYLAGQVCAKDVSFLKLKTHLAEEPSFLIYLNGTKGWQLIAPYFNSGSNVSVSRNPLPFNEMIAVLDWRPGVAEIDFIIPENEKKESSPANILWSAPLLANAASKPYVQTDPSTGEKDIFVYDDDNRIYLINKSGQVMWRRQMPERVLSDIHHINLSNDGEGQFAFSTRTGIYVVDRKGKDVDGFPLALQTPATNGVTVVDFFQSNDYTFFIACENGQAYGFDEKGSPIEGWRPKSGVGIVEKPILHFQADGKDFLALLDIQGELQVYKKNGSPRFKNIRLGTGELQPLDYQVSKKSSRMVTSDRNGKVYVTNLTGGGFGLQLKAGDTENTRFLFSDVTGDDRNDYILLSEKKLTVSFYNDADKFEQGISHVFPWEQDEVFPVKWEHRKKGYIGTLNKKKRRIFLIDGNGKIPDLFPLAGSTPFIIEDMMGDGKPIIITGNGAEITVYSLQ